MMPYRKSRASLRYMNNSFIDLPTPLNLSIWWNLGSLMGVCLVTQMVTGFFLAMHYTSTADGAFASIRHIMVDVNNGWILRHVHANTVSFFLLFSYFHMFRGVYYSCYSTQKRAWMVGGLLGVLLMGEAFLGYVLPYGQMSYWGATVITNLFTAVPYVGGKITEGILGDYAVSGVTLQRFFVLHYALPFLMVVVGLVHMILLHEGGSSNPLGLKSDYYKVHFHPYFIMKDILGVLGFLIALFMVVFFCPWLFLEVDNLTPANSLVTPSHIKPEWYFLQFYAILRVVPNKMGGVFLMFLAIMLPFVYPWWFLVGQKSAVFQKGVFCVFWVQVMSVFALTWLGSCPVEYPYLSVTPFFIYLYFSTIIFGPTVVGWWDYFMNYSVWQKEVSYVGGVLNTGK